MHYKSNSLFLPTMSNHKVKVGKGDALSMLTPESVKANPFQLKKTLDDSVGEYIASGSCGTVIVCTVLGLSIYK